jgi:hypothetical protein
MLKKNKQKKPPRISGYSLVNFGTVGHPTDICDGRRNREMGGKEGQKIKRKNQENMPHELSFIFVGQHPSKEMETNEREWDSCGRHRV